MKRRESWGCQKKLSRNHTKTGCVNGPFKDKRNLDIICLKAKIRVNSLDGLKVGLYAWDIPMNKSSYKVSIPL